MKVLGNFEFFLGYLSAISAFLLSFAALGAYGAVSVTDVKAVQRYPWNGLVDINYTVVCDDATAADVYVFPEGTDNDTGALLQLKTLTGEGANGAVKLTPTRSLARFALARH